MSDRFPAMVEETNSINEEKRELLGWDLLRHTFKSYNNTFDNDKGNDIKERKRNPFYGMTFFNVVKEASAVEKMKKDRPTLEKFLEKYDSHHIPESVTPNARSGFHHSESISSIEDEDTKLLRNSLFRISGECLELAMPTLKVQTIYYDLSFSHHIE